MSKINTEKKPYLYYFCELAAIPHGSSNEKKASDWLVSFAKEHGYDYIQDDALNVIIYKPASPGYEDKAPVMLQGHMDMVCEKNKDSDHNFDTDPLDLYIDDGWLKARGTTLGADDGVAVAYMLAVLADKSLKHPALECVFTTEEEIGLVGALKLDPNHFKARRLISMDGGGESTTAISSAGGLRAKTSFPYKLEEAYNTTFSFAIRGLLGGHSGMYIDKEHGNSNRLAIRILRRLLKEGIKYQLVSIDGGLKENAIPRECDVIIALDKADLKKAQDIVALVEKDIAGEYEFSDPGFKIVYPQAKKVKQAISASDTKKIVQAIYLMPNGFQHKSVVEAMKDLTLASCNCGVINTTKDAIDVCYSMRSAIDSWLEEMATAIEDCGKLAKAKTHFHARYPGWKYSEDNKLRDHFFNIYREIRGGEPTMEATHGGVECSVFKGFFPDMDIITYGPVSEHVHTPDERLDLESFDRAYEVLTIMLERLD
ncbi:MAG: aminoacyl-histidine dipeptidase [Erysipelotrichaceae bacterium]|jgi:dipeptidase D|nr:aminoacyl-histidine dipeptidase [Erysipelotrichaceae bacterium]